MNGSAAGKSFTLKGFRARFVQFGKEGVAAL